MTRYRLPDELGGGEYEGILDVNDPEHNYVHFVFRHGSATFREDALVELVDEPEPGAYLVGEMLCIRFANRGPFPWLVDTDQQNITMRMSWEAMVESLNITPNTRIVRLVPEPERTFVRGNVLIDRLASSSLVQEAESE